jgi:hypothetical protein
MIQLKFLSDGVAGAGLLWLRLFALVTQYANAVKNASLKKCITLCHFTKAALCMTLAILLRYAKNAITTLQSALFRK